MTKPANKRRGETVLPGYPGGRFIRFTVDAQERLQSEYATEENPDWVSTVFDRVGIPDIKMVKLILECTKVGEDPIDFEFMNDTPIVQIVDAIRDGLTLALHGKTVAEHVADLAKREEEELEKKVNRLKEMMEKKGLDPETIDNVIFSQRLGALDIGADSSQQNSDT